MSYFGEVLVREDEKVAQLRAGLSAFESGQAKVEALALIAQEQNWHRTQIDNAASFYVGMASQLSGVDLREVDPQTYELYVRAAIEHERVTKIELDKFEKKASVFGAEDSSVASGLTQFTANGEHSPMQPRGSITFEAPDFGAVLAKVARGHGVRESHDAIRASVLGETPAEAEYAATIRKATKLFGQEESRKLEYQRRGDF